MRQDEGGGEPRFTMLETIREYALEQLAERSEADVSRARHAAYFGALLDRPTVMMLPHLPNTRQVLDRLIMEYPNLRAAMDWHRTTGDVSRVLEIAGTLYFFWQLGGQLVDGRMWLEWGLRQEGSTPDARAAGQLGLAGVYYAQSDGERALMLCQASLEHYTATGDTFGAAFASYVAAHSALFLGDLTLAMGYLEDASTQISHLHGIPGQVAVLNHTSPCCAGGRPSCAAMWTTRPRSCRRRRRGSDHRPRTSAHPNPISLGRCKIWAMSGGPKAICWPRWRIIRLPWCRVGGFTRSAAASER